MATDLPSKDQWVTQIYSNPRQIVNENGGTASGGATIISYDYEGLAARLITIQELNVACGITAGGYTNGELDTCQFLLENTNYSNPNFSIGYWLETPHSIYSFIAWYIQGYARSVSNAQALTTDWGGARPVIEVKKSDIDY